MKRMLANFLYQPFEFEATSYEIYESGCCLCRDTCHTHVTATISDEHDMIFSIKNNPSYIDDVFGLGTAPGDLLDDRVQYGRMPYSTYGINPSTPIACNIFPHKNILRFVTSNPLRLIEFTGRYILTK